MIPPSIDQLRDIHLPPPPAAWPPAPGWWVLLAAGTAVAAWLAYRHRRGKPLRTALRDLDAVARAHTQTHDAVELARGICTVLRSYARRRFPDARIAGLSGPAWLAFLDAHGGHGAFGAGAGAVLDTLPYRPATAAPALSQGEAEALLALARCWLRSNAP